jgi:hypothetical protein
MRGRSCGGRYLRGPVGRWERENLRPMHSRSGRDGTSPRPHQQPADISGRPASSQSARAGREAARTSGPPGQGVIR